MSVIPRVHGTITVWMIWMSGILWMPGKTRMLGTDNAGYAMDIMHGKRL